jgi:hypothetical protein
MLPDLQSSVLCDDVRQERNGKFILIGLFDIIGFARFPAVFQRVCVVNRWCCGSGTFTQRSRIVKPDGRSLLVQGKPVKVNLPGEEATATSVEFFINVRFESPGTHWVEILMEDSLRLRYPIRVQKAKQRPPAATAN